MCQMNKNLEKEGGDNPIRIGLTKTIFDADGSPIGVISNLITKEPVAYIWIENRHGYTFEISLDKEKKKVICNQPIWGIENIIRLEPPTTLIDDTLFMHFEMFHLEVLYAFAVTAITEFASAKRCIFDINVLDIDEHGKYLPLANGRYPHGNSTIFHFITECIAYEVKDDEEYPINFWTVEEKK